MVGHRGAVRRPVGGDVNEYLKMASGKAALTF